MKKETKIIISFIGSGIVGLINTLLIRPEDIGSWKNYVGYVFLIISAANLIWLLDTDFSFKLLIKASIPLLEITLSNSVC